jgi:hypothetical protein
MVRTMFTIAGHPYDVHAGRASGSRQVLMGLPGSAGVRNLKWGGAGDVMLAGTILTRRNPLNHSRVDIIVHDLITRAQTSPFPSIAIRSGSQPTIRGMVMKLPRVLCLMPAALLSIAGCTSHSVPGSPGVPKPIRVLENPQTGERVRLFKEIGFKTPAGYDEQKHIAEWTATHNKDGFTKEISTAEDRPQLAELREKNLAASKSKK